MSAANWCRIEIEGNPQLGRLEGDRIALCKGGLFAGPVATGVEIDAATATWLPPVEPRQFLGLWNNFHERQQREKTQIPDFPLFFVKLGDRFLPTDVRSGVLPDSAAGSNSRPNWGSSSASPAFSPNATKSRT